ncbi:MULTISPECIES: hypothetical protein [Mycobacterium]|uniref:Uncharacterized protein n=2 Tax=Mycobacterium TaxID=1763 RepID=A0A1X1XBL4_9MYCO|nr:MULTISPECIES: hypothetical protein [Mycobacterium]MBZ4631304.1 hypothetical protein [Mycobacterium avium subsp. hominissuis]ORV96050.1 hypothetical protein AWC14_17275 [Mycobacterium kyorinense]PBJ41368.1 hypothetical protein XV03_00450 [Mycobacterium avium subsp. hominissuis]PBJ67458.1 hypothetical protein BB737_02000 [Mycobacterium avium subsp. hominissuis]QWY65356.1 hypothetical protein BJP78_27180 [Mycobacterium avium subsp. hominissuis]
MTASRVGAPDPGLVEVLAGARTIALNFWNADEFDIYDCLRRSWYVREMPIALAAVLRATRRAVPGGDLYAVNDAEGCTAERIAEVFNVAIAKVLQAQRKSGTQVAGAAKSVPFTGGGGR